MKKNIHFFKSTNQQFISNYGNTELISKYKFDKLFGYLPIFYNIAAR